MKEKKKQPVSVSKMIIVTMIVWQQQLRRQRQKAKRANKKFISKPANTPCPLTWNKISQDFSKLDHTVRHRANPL